jgi:hypothetical protein
MIANSACMIDHGGKMNSLNVLINVSKNETSLCKNRRVKRYYLPKNERKVTARKTQES